MFYRLAYWIGGFFLVALAAAAWERVDRSSALVVGFGLWLACGVVVELSFALRHALSGQHDVPERALRASDGRREIAAVEGGRVRPNAVDGRFGRLTGWEEGRAFFDSHRRKRSFPSPLRGRVVLVSYFLGRDNHTWTDAEIAEAHGFLWRAAAWVEREAARWHAPVNVALANAYLASTDAAPRSEAILEVRELAHKELLLDPKETTAVVAAMRRGVEPEFGSSLEHVAAEFARRLDCDHVVWMVHSRSAGGSQWLNERLTGLDGMPFALCYAQEAEYNTVLESQPFANPITIVHELLHAFGATDHYGISAKRFGRRQVTAGDVMLLHDDRRLSQLRIDPLTAEEIGWVAKHQRPAASAWPEEPHRAEGREASR
jgi:hypothetical protein